MNGHDFISSHHVGIQNMGGMSGTSWYHDQRVSINYKDNTFRPGHQITFEVYDYTTHQIISRDTFPHAEKQDHDVTWFYSRFINRQVA
jgi:hypothetical protein